MSELGEPERALLALAGDAHDPTDADRARVRSALAARLGVAAGLGVSAAGVAATAKAATAGATGVATTAKAVAAGATGLGSAGTASAVVTGGALATKLVVAVALTATVGVGASVKLIRHGAHGPSRPATGEVHARLTAAATPGMPAPHRPLPASSSDEAPGAATPSAMAPQDAPRAAPPARTMPPAVAPATIRQPPTMSDARALPASEASRSLARPAPPVTSAAPARQSSPLTAPPPAAAVSGHRSSPAVSRAAACGAGAADPAQRSELTVADEARLVHDGVRALHEGQAACALSLLDTHAHFYPHGVLAEERDAERAVALADLGRIVEARAVATAFLRAHPTSPLGVRLRQRIPGLDAIDHDMSGGATAP